MKKIRLFVKSTLSIVSVLFIFSCGNNEAKTVEENNNEEKGHSTSSTCTLTCAGETTLALKNHTLDPTSARNERSLFSSEVSVAGHSVDLRCDSIPYDEFCSLKSKASGITSGCGTSSIITGVKISMGLETTLTKMKLIYEPVKLCLTSTAVFSYTDAAGTHSYTAGTFSVVGTNGKRYYYSQSDKLFKELSTSTADADTARYIRNFMIKHTAGSSPTHFTVNSSNDTLTDVKSVIFSFQEIIALYNDNSPKPNYIKVWNSVREYSYVSLAGSTIRKHSIYMGTDKMDKSRKPIQVFIYAGEFSGAYANLAHLCPPHCTKLVYRLN